MTHIANSTDNGMTYTYNGSYGHDYNTGYGGYHYGYPWGQEKADWWNHLTKDNGEEGMISSSNKARDLFKGTDFYERYGRYDGQFGY